jgi:hypothetical protein
MNEQGCHEMELYCRQRAIEDPKNGRKWLGQAERWCALAHAEHSWRVQKRSTQQMMQHAGPMATQPNASKGPVTQQT